MPNENNEIQQNEQQGTTLQQLIIQFEDILPWGTTGGDTGLSARLKLKRNFDKIKAWMDVIGAQQYLSKTDDDEASGEIGFLKGLWIKEKGLFGFDADGLVMANAIKIGDIYIGYDQQNNSLKVYKLDANNEPIAANFYALGGISALGQSIGGNGNTGALADLTDVELSTLSDNQVLTYSNGKWRNMAAQSGGVDMNAVWSALGDVTTTQQIALSHLTTALSGYATQSWIQNQGYLTSTALSGYATESWVQSQGYLTSASINGYLPLTGGTLSGVLSSTVADGTSPFVVTSTTKVTNLNADMLDGLHSTDFLSTSYQSKRLSSVGWYRVAQLESYSASYLFSLGEHYNNREPSGVSFIIQTAYTAASITQINRCAIPWKHVQKIRLVRYAYGKYYLDIYYNYSNNNTEDINILNISNVSASTPKYGVTLINFTKITELGEGETVVAEESLSIYMKADKLATPRSLWGNSFDGTADIDGSITMSSANGTFIQIGNIRIVYDSTNNALKVVQSDGTTAANFYATGGISALGQSSGGSGSVAALADLTDVELSTLEANQVLTYSNGKWRNMAAQSTLDMNAVWTALGDNTTTQQIASSHLTTALANYVLKTDLVTTTTDGLMSAADKKYLSRVTPIVWGSANTAASQQYTFFARTTGNKSSRYCSLTALVHGLGYSYANQFTGTYIVELRYYNGSPSMQATVLSPKGATGTVEFGYYENAEDGYVYFGVRTSTRHNAICVEPLNNQNAYIVSLEPFTVLTAAPEGWTAITTKQYADASSYLPLSGGTMTGTIVLPSGCYLYGANETYGAMVMWDGSRTVLGSAGSSSTLATHIRSITGHATIGASTTASYTVWDSGNDGAGSGLDADLLDGTHKADLFTALTSNVDTPLTITIGGTTKTLSTLYASQLATSVTLWGQTFDGSGNVSGAIANANNITPQSSNTYTLGTASLVWANIYATTFTGDLTGNADTATTLATSVTLWGQTFDGSGNVSGAIANANNITPQSSNTYTLGTASLVWANIYATTFTGDLTGNADTATTLATARTLWGRSFDGSANVTGTITVGAGDIVLNNNRYLYCKNSGGTSIDALRMTSSNNLALGNGMLGKSKITYVIGDTVVLRTASGVNSLSVLSSGNVGIGNSSPTYKLDVNGTGHFANDLTVDGSSMYINGMIQNVTTIDLNASGLLSGYGGFIDFHYNGSSADYTSRIAEYTSGYLSLDAHTVTNGNSYVNGEIYLRSNYFLMNTLNDVSHSGIGLMIEGYAEEGNIMRSTFGFHTAGDSVSWKDGVYPFQMFQSKTDASNRGIQIGQARLMWDAANNALKVVRSDGTAGNFYATGGISALGLNSIVSESITINLLPNQSYLYQLGNASKIWNYLYVKEIDMKDSSYWCNINLQSDGLNIDCFDGLYFTGYNDIQFYTTGSFIVNTKLAVNTSTYSSTYALYVSGNSYFTGSISAQTVTQRSDMRTKDVVENLSLKVESIANAPSFRYTPKDDVDKVLVGTSAQYWQAILPQTVFSDESGLLSLDYGVTALASVISVAKEVTEHERRIAKLEAENMALRAEIKNLKAA